MRAYTITRLFCLLIIALILTGCSGNGNPLTPDSNKRNSNPLDIQDTIPLIGTIISDDNFFETTGIMGAYNLTIMEDKVSAELVSKRLLSVGESYIVDATAFFTITPCSNCLKLVSLALEPPYIKATFKVSHPFEKGDSSKPPSARNRLDLDLFDLALVVRPIGIEPTNYSLTDANLYDGACGNANGYTRELENLTKDSSACPYYLVVDDSATGISTFNKFEMGTKDIEFDTWFKGGFFELYLTTGYGASAKKSDRLNPEYFNPEFNRKAAWKVEVLPPNGNDPPTIDNTWNAIDSTTERNVTVKVYDWQIGANVDPELGNQTDVYAASEVGNVSVEIPGMNNALPAVNTPANGAGTPSDPLIFNVPIANENLLSAGEYVGIAKVSDTRPVMEPPPVGDRDYLIHSPDGLSIVNYALPEYATYQTFIATVVVTPSCGPITGQITEPICPLSGVGDDAYVDFTAAAFSANGGDPIILYEWDHDYDGITFDSEFTGATVSIGPFDNPNCPIPTPVTYTVAVRATDSCVPPNVTIFATCDVTVDSCCTDQELLYDFTGCGSPTSWVFTCQGWQAGGCGLPNQSSSMGKFKWGCDVQSPCGMTYQYVTSGGGEMMGSGDSCDYIFAHGSNANFNVVSPVINLPTSSNGVIEFDHCNAFASEAMFSLLISENGCAGPWTQIWSTTTANGCFNDTTVDIHDYSGSNIMFRFQYQSSAFIVYGGSCGNDGSGNGAVGVTFDNIRIYGCFNGTLSD